VRPPNAKPCDGTPQDYRRHSYYGEEPCVASREAWRKSHRFYRFTNIYSTGEKDNAAEVHPFFYRKPKRMSKRYTNKKREQ